MSAPLPSSLGGGCDSISVGVIQLMSTHFSVVFLITNLMWYRYCDVALPSRTSSWFLSITELSHQAASQLATARLEGGAGFFTYTKLGVKLRAVHITRYQIRVLART